MYIRPSPEDSRVEKYTTYSAYTQKDQGTEVACGNRRQGHLRGLGWRAQKSSWALLCLLCFTALATSALYPALSEGGKWSRVLHSNLGREDKEGWEENRGAVTKREGGVL